MSDHKFSVTFWVEDPEAEDDQRKDLFSYSQPSKPDWRTGDRVSFNLDNSTHPDNKFHASTQEKRDWMDKHMRFCDLEITGVGYYFREHVMGKAPEDCKTVEDLLNITSYCSVEVECKIVKRP